MDRGPRPSTISEEKRRLRMQLLLLLRADQRGSRPRSQTTKGRSRRHQGHQQKQGDEGKSRHGTALILLPMIKGSTSSSVLYGL